MTAGDDDRIAVAIDAVNKDYARLADAIDAAARKALAAMLAEQRRDVYRQHRGDVR